MKIFIVAEEFYYHGTILHRIVAAFADRDLAFSRARLRKISQGDDARVVVLEYEDDGYIHLGIADPSEEYVT